MLKFDEIQVGQIIEMNNNVQTLLRGTVIEKTNKDLTIQEEIKNSKFVITKDEINSGGELGPMQAQKVFAYNV